MWILLESRGLRTDDSGDYDDSSPFPCLRWSSRSLALVAGEERSSVHLLPLLATKEWPWYCLLSLLSLL